MFTTRHSFSMMTSSNGNIFRVTGPLCGEFTGPGEFPTQRPVTRSFDVFFDLRLNKRLSKQQRGWWFETQAWSLWRHCNVIWSCWHYSGIILCMRPANQRWHYNVTFSQWPGTYTKWSLIIYQLHGSHGVKTLISSTWMTFPCCFLIVKYGLYIFNYLLEIVSCGELVTYPCDIATVAISNRRVSYNLIRMA